MAISWNSCICVRVKKMKYPLHFISTFVRVYNKSNFSHTAILEAANSAHKAQT